MQQLCTRARAKGQLRARQRRAPCCAEAQGGRPDRAKDGEGREPRGASKKKKTLNVFAVETAVPPTTKLGLHKLPKNTQCGDSVSLELPTDTGAQPTATAAQPPPGRGTDDDDGDVPTQDFIVQKVRAPRLASCRGDATQYQSSRSTPSALPDDPDKCLVSRRCRQVTYSYVLRAGRYRRNGRALAVTPVGRHILNKHLEALYQSDGLAGDC